LPEVTNFGKPAFSSGQGSRTGVSSYNAHFSCLLNGRRKKIMSEQAKKYGIIAVLVLAGAAGIGHFVLRLF
jgi:hypothetical protein